MPTTQILPQPPSTQGSNLSATDYLWMLIVQNLAPLYEVDTSKGSYSENAPPAGVGASGQSGQCKEITYVKTSGDANIFTLNGVQGGPLTLKLQYSFLKIKSDGTNWYPDSAAGGGSGAVSSVFGRTGAVVAVGGDYTVAKVTGAAPLASPALTGVPTAPTAAPATNTTQLATTAFVQAAIPAALNFADMETPAGTLDGVNKVFTLAHAPNPAASLQLFNGLMQQAGGNDYTLAGNTITFTAAPTVGSTLLAWYRY